MGNDITWEEFCNLYYDTAKEYARINMAKQKKLLGGLDRHVDEDYVIDDTVLSSLEKTYASYTSSRGAKVTTLLSRIVHNQLIDILESENKRGARKDELEVVERTLGEHLRAEALEVPREDLVARLMEAVSRLSPSDQVIIECYLSDRKTFVDEASGILDVSKNYVSVRKNRILLQLRSLMDTTESQYQEWKLSRYAEPKAYAGLEDPVQIYNPSTADEDLFEESFAVHKPAVNPIMPGISLYGIASMLLEANMTV